tara:strand:- start:1084 stop:1359 length:276 start_codon:yes stop_codon:yes gene_type:complete
MSSIDEGSALSGISTEKGNEGTTYKRESALHRSIKKKYNDAADWISHKSGELTKLYSQVSDGIIKVFDHMVHFNVGHLDKILKAEMGLPHG